MMADGTTTVAETQQAPAAQDAIAGENTGKYTDLEF